jgi:hypothetical protein
VITSNDPITLLNAFAATLIPAAKRRSDATKALIGWMPVHNWRGHRHKGGTTVLLQYLGLSSTFWRS